MTDTQGVTLVTLVPSRSKRLVKHVELRWVIRNRSVQKALRRFFGGQRLLSGASVYLEALNFIHFGRWIIINRSPWRSFMGAGFPNFGDQPPENSDLAIMVFTSNFDFDWKPYVDTFTETAIDDLGVLWDETPDWREPTESGFAEFFDWVDRHVIEHGHYYAAFPDMATANMKSALFVDRTIRSFARSTSEFNDDDWDLAYDRLISTLQRDLGSVDRSPELGQPEPAWADGGHGHLGLTFLAPLPREHIPTVRETLSRLDDTNSPFARLPGTHFARMSIIDKVLEKETATDLASGYILLSVDADAPQGGQKVWLENLHEEWSDFPQGSGRNLIDEIWGSCWDFDTGVVPEVFVDYMERTAFKATLPFADYPNTSLWDIHRAIGTQAWFSDLAFNQNQQDRRSEFDAAFAASIPIDPP